MRNNFYDPILIQEKFEVPKFLETIDNYHQESRIYTANSEAIKALEGISQSLKEIKKTANNG